MVQEGVAAMSLGYFHSIVCTTDGKILVCGRNEHGHLAIDNNNDQHSWNKQSKITADMMTTHDLNAQYWQSKELEASQEYIQEITNSVDQAHAKSADGARVNPAPLWLGSWKRCAKELQERVETYQSLVATQKELKNQQQAHISSLKSKISELQKQLADVEEQERQTSSDLGHHELQLETMQKLQAKCATVAVPETELLQKLNSLLSQKPLVSLESDELALVWWRMGLDDKQQEELKKLKMDGQMMRWGPCDWKTSGLSSYQAAQCHFVSGMCRATGLFTLGALDDEDCVVCNNNTVRSTINLLKEMHVEIADSVIIEGHWITPLLIYAVPDAEVFEGFTYAQILQIRSQLAQLEESHQKHLNEIAKEIHSAAEDGEA